MRDFWKNTYQGIDRYVKIDPELFMRLSKLDTYPRQCSCGLQVFPLDTRQYRPSRHRQPTRKNSVDKGRKA